MDEPIPRNVTGDPTLAKPVTENGPKAKDEFTGLIAETQDLVAEILPQETEQIMPVITPEQKAELEKKRLQDIEALLSDLPNTEGLGDLIRAHYQVISGRNDFETPRGLRLFSRNHEDITEDYGIIDIKFGPHRLDRIQSMHKVLNQSKGHSYTRKDLSNPSTKDYFERTHPEYFKWYPWLRDQGSFLASSQGGWPLIALFDTPETMHITANSLRETIKSEIARLQGDLKNPLSQNPSPESVAPTTTATQ